MTSKEDLIRNIRYVGESLIKNAESIVGTEEFLNDLVIRAHIPIYDDEIPSVKIEKIFIPEQHVKSLTNLNFLDENGDYSEVD